MSRIIKSIFTVLIFATVSFAADPSFKISRAQATCTVRNGVPLATEIEIVFENSLDPVVLAGCNSPEADCQKKITANKTWLNGMLRSVTNYHLINVATGAPRYLVPGTVGTVLDNTITFELATAYLFDGAHILIAKAVNPAAPAPFMVKIEPKSGCELPPGKLPVAEKTKEEKEAEEAAKDKKIDDYFAEPKNKESPILKVDFALQGAKRQQALYSFNVKFRPHTTRRLGFGGHYDLTWFFVDTEYKINAKEGDKKNVLNVGVLDFNWTKVWRDDGDERDYPWLKYFPGLVLSVTPKLETEWRFKEQNLLISPKGTLPVNLYQSRGTTIQFSPFAGFDVGYKRKTVDVRPGWRVVRPFFGGGLTMNFLRKEEKPRFSFQIDYIRRLFVHPELSHGFDSEGKEIPDQSTKTPRDHGKVKFIFNVTSLLAPFFEWEYGRVPPKYSLINSSFKSGIVFDVDLAWKAFKK
jgi:hypothetical protein